MQSIDGKWSLPVIDIYNQPHLEKGFYLNSIIDALMLLRTEMVASFIASLGNHINQNVKKTSPIEPYIFFHPVKPPWYYKSYHTYLNITRYILFVHDI